MGRYIGPKNKIARRFGINLGLKTNSAKVARRIKQMPGVHGPNKRGGSRSSYGRQLMEKQKAKFIYGLREKQFRGYVDVASNMEGDSGVNLQQILEKRLDNVVYRLGFADTRAQARQFVSHSLFSLNGKKMNIPSHLTKVGDVVALKLNKQKKVIFENIEEKLQAKEMPSWLRVDPAKKSGTILGLPSDRDFDQAFDVKLIIEYYSAR
ncbi:30S ribosomal protein S4 [Patescibacteria group bacterium]|nr:30S ribosomal protein S4 [Patescibacteria group bacterium]MBU1895985.1 30S ribosomal protein S4 [Patescibacteria group bacterium]